jgi:PAS domain S-box-containing protein
LHGRNLLPEGRFLQIYKKFYDLVGYLEEEMLDLTFQDFTHPDDLVSGLEIMRRVLNRV